MQVNPKPVRAKIELRVSAGEKIIQRIPIVNTGEKEMRVDCKLITSTDNGKWFTGGKDLSIQAGTTGHSVITFSP